jgi:AsmA protein
MTRFLKSLLKGFLKITLILGVIIIALTFVVVNFVNPAQFKPLIEKQVLAQTGHILTIQGPVSWKCWPMLGLNLEQTILTAPAPVKEPLFSAQSITAKVALLPLMVGKLFLNLTINGLDLRFERNAEGQINWDPLKQRLLSAHIPSQSDSAFKIPQPYRFYLNSLEITNGKIRLQDDKNHWHYTFADVNFYAKNLLSGLLQKTNPISLSFTLQDKTKTLGTLHLSTEWSLQQNQDLLNIQDLSLKLEPINGKATLCTANVTIKNLRETPLIQGTAETKNVDLNTWLKHFNIQENPAIPPAMNIALSFKYQSPRLEISSFNISSFNIDAKNNGTLNGRFDLGLSLAPLQLLDLKGDFYGKQLKIGTFTIAEIKSPLIGKQNVITLNPIVFKIAEISQQATLQANLQGAVPRFSLTAEGQNFEINQLLTAFNVKNKLTGNTRYTANLHTTGKNAYELRENLTGHATVEVSNGKLYGINLVNLLKTAQASVRGLVNALIHKQPFNVANTLNSEYQRWGMTPSNTQDFTPFDNAKASLNIANALAKNPDLLITHSEYNINGSGTFNLNNEAIQYQVAILLKKNPYPLTDEVASYLYATPLPVVVSGTLSNPSIRPDLDSYANRAFAYAQKHFIEKLINKTINKALENLLIPKQ